MNYRDKIQKEITLPSGSTIVIKKLTTFNGSSMEKKFGESDIDYSIRIAKFVLLSKTGLLDGKLTIVERVENPESQISIEEILQEDANAIFDSVIEFSNLSKRDQGARMTFPEDKQGTEAGCQCAPNGQDVSGDTPIPTARPVAG